MRNLIIIPARAGSVRVKNKNTRKIKNKPLIFWTIDFAKKLRKLIPNLEIIVSTDCPKIKKISRSMSVKFIDRPKNLATAKANVYLAINHVLKNIENSKRFEFVILLQPTSPIRKFYMVKKGLSILRKKPTYENLIHLENTNKYLGKIIKNEWKPTYPENTRSQDIVNQFTPSGCLYIYRRKNFENSKKYFKRKVYGYVDNKIKTVNIDCEEDIDLLNYYVKKNSSKIFSF